MRKYAAASFVVLGIILSAYALGTSESITGPWPGDKPTRFLIGGMLSIMVGFSLVSHRRQRA